MPEVLLLPQISLIQSSAHRITVQKRSFEVMGAIYRQLYEACHEPKNLYQNPNSLFNHAPDELLNLLISH